MSASADDLEPEPLRHPVTFLPFRAKSSSGEIGSDAVLRRTANLQGLAASYHALPLVLVGPWARRFRSRPADPDLLETCQTARFRLGPTSAMRSQGRAVEVRHGRQPQMPRARDVIGSVVESGKFPQTSGSQGPDAEAVQQVRHLHVGNVEPGPFGSDGESRTYRSCAQILTYWQVATRARCRDRNSRSRQTNRRRGRAGGAVCVRSAQRGLLLSSARSPHRA